MGLSRYFWNLLIALDQLANAGAGGEPDETISSRWGRTRENNPVADVGCKVLDVVDKDHCADSVEFTPEGEPDPHHLGGADRK